jgi:non-homologous end joining protein Ku
MPTTVWNNNSRHAELVSRGKEQLVLIRPYKNGLVLHTMYYADEGRVFSQVPKAENVKVSKQEVELGVGFVDKLSAESSTRNIIKTNIGSACSPSGRKEQRPAVN